MTDANRITTGNFEWDDTTVTVRFFNSRGKRNLVSRWWYSNRGKGDALRRVAREDALKAITDCILRDVKAGRMRHVKMILVQPEAAVVLFLQEAFTADSLRQAVDTGHYIDIPNVWVHGLLTCTVRVVPDLKSFVATADKQGVVIPD